MVVRELFVRLGFKLDDTKPIDNTIDRMRGALAGLAAAFSLRNIIDIGDEMQSLRARIGMLPQTVGDVGVAFDTIVDKANNAKQSVDAYASFYIKAGNATQDFITSQEELSRVVDGAAFGLAASGANAVSQKQAFFQLGQAIGSPVVQMEEMNTLIDVAPDLFRELGKSIPGADGNLKKFIGTGKVTGRMLAEGLAKAADVFEAKMLKIPLTVGQATQIVNNKFSRMIDRMNRESMFITRIADTILKAFDEVEKGVDSLVEKFGGWNNTLRIIGVTILTAFGANALKAMYKFGASAIIASGGTATLGASLTFAARAAFMLMARFVIFAAIIAIVAFFIDDLWVTIKGGDSYMNDFYKWLTNGSAGATALGLALTALAGATAVWATISAANYAKVALAATIAGFSAMRAGAMVAVGWLIALGPIGLVIAAIAGIGVAGYLIMENWQSIKNWFSDTFDWFGNKFKDLAGWLNNVFNKAVGNTDNPITPSEAVQVVKEKSKPISDAVQTVKEKSKPISDAVQTVKEKSKPIIDSVRPAINSQNGQLYQNQVQQSQMAPAGGKSVIDNRQTNVTVTVPPGTSQEQATFLQKAAQTSFADVNKPLNSMDMATYSD